MAMEIFPNLPYDVGRECLARVPFTSHFNMAAVCKSWKNTVNSSLFYHDRQKLNMCQDLMVMVEDDPTSVCDAPRRVVIYDPLDNSRGILPSVPIEFQHYSHESHCVSVNNKLIVLGLSKQAKEMVFVYDFCIGKWKRGADLLKRIYGFCCSADSVNGLIYIAGGCDEDCKEVIEAAVYNVEKNSWQPLPRMNFIADECYSGFADGKFFVVCEYEPKAQVYDPHTGTWTTIDRYSVDPCLAAFGRLYYFQSCGKVIEYNYLENEWSVAGTIPRNFIVEYATLWRDIIFVWGFDRKRYSDACYLFEPYTTDGHGHAGNTQKWTPMDIASHFSNWIYSIAFLKI
ncbi:hypothetical protein KI387_040559 [Taxus chinensis]|uniref:F-box domain-containing protein n=1 Tax=Taxus chinensis TaxID=29808 RepID=A0AA38F9T2_TAXCH|nr:hypothetical protein KI387_040559 [Taxus chinensis]